MKTEKRNFTAAEIHETIQALANEDVAIQTYERRPLADVLEMLDSTSLTALQARRGIVKFLMDGHLPPKDARPSDGKNTYVIHALDLWIDTFASTPIEIAAGLVAQIPHMIASAWKRGYSAPDSILKLESAMYQFTALQLEADFRWIEETANEVDPVQDALAQLQQLALSLIRAVERQKAGAGSDYVGHYADEIAQVAKGLQTQPPEEEGDFDNFGLCPECQKLDMFDIGKEQFGVCHEHKVWWTIGQVFGADPQTDQEREKNERILTQYRQVKPFHYPRPEIGQPVFYTPDPNPPF